MGPSQPGYSGSPGTNEKVLFWASFLTLIAAGIGFSVRGAIIGDWGNQYGFTQTELGTITGGGLIGFGLAIIFFSFFADLFGYGKLMAVAFLLHFLSAIVTFAATYVYESQGKNAALICLSVGMWLFALGNGTCEAVINPLTATLFPKNKTHWLNILHAGWPLGLILGALIVLGFKSSGQSIRWEYKLGIFLVPVLLYGLMMLGRKFPKSEAESAGVELPSMMGAVGFIGFLVAAVFLSFAFPSLIEAFGYECPKWAGYAIAGGLWLIYALYSKFSPGSLLIGFLYILHALVGYVELGTDSWITNIQTRVLKDGNLALMLFIWTNILMFVLRFFAGPIVHKINPIGLLVFSAIAGCIGLALMGLPITNSIVPLIAAVTIYGIGKTFYWPTVLGVISERFPKGGALALGLSGGIGMISAGFFGGPGIGYKQDYLAVNKLNETNKDTYERYKPFKDEKGNIKENGFPIGSEYLPNVAPKIVGLDNSKLKLFDDYAEKLEAEAKGKKDHKTTLESDLATIAKLRSDGKEVPVKLEDSLKAQKEWWDKEGQPSYEKDKDALNAARDHGAKTALLYTAAVPALLAVGFLILFLYFASIGGYKQVHLDANKY